MTEAAATAAAMGVPLPEEMVDKHMIRLEHTEDASTSSLSRDFEIGRIGEMELFSGDLVRMAETCGVDVPVSREYYQGLKERAAEML